MALHQFLQRLILYGAPIDSLPAAPEPQPPPRLLPLIQAIAPAHRGFNERALLYGDRYRSGFWAIYLLSAVAVLFAILPLALGWDSRVHALHPFAGLWAVAEVGVIALVSLIYWRGHRRDWQGEWLRTRTTAELAWYLPLLAPLVDFDRRGEPNWYARVFDPRRHPDSTDEVTALCSAHESLARNRLQGAWSDPEFVDGYAQWAIDVLQGQRRYHHRVASKQHALLHRVHSVNLWLFSLTAVGAFSHLLLHTLWLSLITTFFPALGASLHGALAQSEAYRLSATADRLVDDLGGAVELIRSAHGESARSARDDPGAEPRIAGIKTSIEHSLALILKEHQDWQMLVRPHRLPLA